jgi:tetratricopeptide (TPR) repeat protein
MFAEPGPEAPMAASIGRDLEIRIHPSAAIVAPALVSVHVIPDDRRADGHFTSPFSAEEVDEALQWMEQGLFDEDFVKEFGAKLFDALFEGQVGQIYHAIRDDGTDMRLRLVVDDSAAARIPWELLYDTTNQAFVALQVPLVRGMSIAEPTKPLEAEAPLRILVLDSFPRGVLPVQGQVEAEGIRTALKKLVRRKRVEVRTLPHATLSGLQDALREGRDPERPAAIHVVHFIGHARHDRRTGRTVLLFEREDGAIDEVDPDTLVNVVSGSDVRMLFLNACQTAHLPTLDAARAFAPALLRSGVPAVIGMQVVVLDDVAVRFAREFYAALADNRPVDVAVLDARRLVRSDRVVGKADMGIPVCYLRSATGQILTLRPPAKVRLTPGTWWEWTRERVTAGKVAAAIVAIVGLVSGAIAIYQFVIHPSPPPMSGDFNIAVADFAGANTAGDPAGSVEASGLARSVHETLERELKGLSGFIVEVRSPSDTGRLPGATAEERARAAEALAREINADVVVYGTLSADGKDFEPEFFLSEQKLTGAEELVGQYELGTALRSLVDIAKNPAARRALRERLLARVHALAEFVIGLSYFTLDDFVEAESHIEGAAKTEGWEDRDGKEVAYLFLGSARGEQGNLAEAREAYDRALGLNPEYSRALYGLAEVRFQESKGTCEAGTVDVAGLREAGTGYRRAGSAPVQPPLADMPTKVHFGLARVFVCLSQGIVEDRWGDAEREFRAVIAEFDRGNERVKELAAESYAGLGFVYLPMQGDTDAREKYQKALASYIRAIELTEREDRRDVFRDQARFICGRLVGLGAQDACEGVAA